MSNLKFRWNNDMIEQLLTYLKEYKVMMAFQAKDFDGDRPAQYGLPEKRNGKTL